MITDVLNTKRDELNEHYGEGIVKFRCMKLDLLKEVKKFMAFQKYLCPGALDEDCFHDAIGYLLQSVQRDNNGYKNIRRGFLQECQHAVNTRNAT